MYASAKRLGNPLQMFCPCIDCRNLCHHTISTVHDHLVIKRMDHKYKRNACWSIHGEMRTEKTVDDQRPELETYELLRSAFFDNEDNSESSNKDGEQPEVVGSEELQFEKKLEDAKTPLYPDCTNYTKIPTIMGLYRIKVKSAISEN